jgi:hypothetical protein
MSSRGRPPAPWYSTTTRRLALVRVGLPTLLACAIAVGSAVAVSAPGRAAQRIAALVVHKAVTVTPVPDQHSEHHRGGGGDSSSDGG